MNILNLVISLVSGAIGGNVAGAAMKQNSLGTVGNSIAGILGGGAGAAILQALGVATTTGATDIGSILANVVGGGVGGAILMAIVGMIRQAAARKA